MSYAREILRLSLITLCIMAAFPFVLLWMGANALNKPEPQD